MSALNLTRRFKTAMLSASTVLALMVALAPSSASAQSRQQQSFSFGFNTSSGYNRGNNGGGFYNNNYSRSNWGLQVQGSQRNNGPFGGSSQGYNVGIGGGQQRQWGNGWGASGPYNYNNYNQNNWGYANGYRNRW
jgi:hypothetical protein